MKAIRPNFLSLSVKSLPDFLPEKLLKITISNPAKMIHLSPECECINPDIVIICFLCYRGNGNSINILSAMPCKLSPVILSILFELES